MASITIRKLEEGVKTKLRVRAARHGRSMEQEAREILKSALLGEAAPAQNFADALRRHVEPLGGVEIRLPRREAIRRPPKVGR